MDRQETLSDVLNETARTIFDIAETITAAAKAPGTVKKSLPLAT